MKRRLFDYVFILSIFPRNASQGLEKARALFVSVCAD